MVDACPANGGVLAQRVLRFCASPVRFVKLWYQTGHPDRIGPRWHSAISSIPIWLFLHIPFWYCYSATQPFGTIATRGYGVVATVIAPLRAPRRSPAHCRMQKGASKHPISSRRPRFWSYQAAERRSLRKDLLKPQQHCVKLG